MIVIYDPSLSYYYSFIVLATVITIMNYNKFYNIGPVAYAIKVFYNHKLWL